jgi:hypothetical protein
VVAAPGLSWSVAPPATTTLPVADPTVLGPAEAATLPTLASCTMPALMLVWPV